MGLCGNYDGSASNDNTKMDGLQGKLLSSSRYNAIPIYRCLFPPNISRETPIARPLGRGMGVFRKILLWP